MEKAFGTGNEWLLPSHRPHAARLGPSAGAAFLAVSPRPPSQLGAREAAPDAVCGAGSNGRRSLEAFPQVRPMVRAV